ncbi:MAG: thioredoxin family protein [Fluviicola sp.]|jgi:protein disulfide-isomerase
MKKLSLALIALSLSLVSIGQTAKKTTKTKKTTPKTEKKVEKTETVAKVEETAGLKWYTDLNEAQAAAKKSGKPLMLFFTGSDWCGWCKRLDAEVFSKPEFKTWSDKEVIMLVVDFPRASILSEAQKTQNMKLQQQFAIRGYPTIVFANVSGESDQMALAEKGRTGYLAGGPATWIANANTLIGK